MGGGQGNDNGNGEDKDDKNRKRYRGTKYSFEEEVRKRVILKILLSLKLLHSS